MTGMFAERVAGVCKDYSSDTAAIRYNEHPCHSKSLTYVASRQRAKIKLLAGKRCPGKHGAAWPWRIVCCNLDSRAGEAGGRRCRVDSLDVRKLPSKKDRAVYA
jgi:hypothetical protein